MKIFVPFLFSARKTARENLHSVLSRFPNLLSFSRDFMSTDHCCTGSPFIGRDGPLGDASIESVRSLA
jgi:hypothetical protein